MSTPSTISCATPCPARTVRRRPTNSVRPRRSVAGRPSTWAARRMPGGCTRSPWPRGGRAARSPPRLRTRATGVHPARRRRTRRRARTRRGWPASRWHACLAGPTHLAARGGGRSPSCPRRARRGAASPRRGDRHASGERPGRRAPVPDARRRPPRPLARPLPRPPRRRRCDRRPRERARRDGRGPVRAGGDGPSRRPCPRLPGPAATRTSPTLTHAARPSWRAAPAPNVVTT